jgi:hypothetical protein
MVSKKNILITQENWSHLSQEGIIWRQHFEGRKAEIEIVLAF